MGVGRGSHKGRLPKHFEAQLQTEHALHPGDEAAGIEYSLQLAMRF